jgi:rhodanese-related sulfurtransferase
MNRLKSFAPVAAVLLLALAACGYVKESMSDDLPKISINDLDAALQAKSVTVIDNNNEETFRKNHIPTAIHMDTSGAGASVLPADKSAALVFYCKNTMCMASHMGARVALKNGYTNVKVLPDGIDGWMKAGKAVETGTP